MKLEVRRCEKIAKHILKKSERNIKRNISIRGAKKCIRKY